MRRSTNSAQTKLGQHIYIDNLKSVRKFGAQFIESVFRRKERGANRKLDKK